MCVSVACCWLSALIFVFSSLMHLHAVVLTNPSEITAFVCKLWWSWLPVGGRHDETIRSPAERLHLQPSERRPAWGFSASMPVGSSSRRFAGSLQRAVEIDSSTGRRRASWHPIRLSLSRHARIIRFGPWRVA